ncbi:MAG: AraC family transcriptional regulator [Polyangiaceae bacterium]
MGCRFEIRGASRRDVVLPGARSLLFVERGSLALVIGKRWQLVRQGSVVVASEGTLRLSAGAEVLGFALPGDVVSEVLPPERLAGDPRLLALATLLRAEHPTSRLAAPLAEAFFLALTECRGEAAPALDDEAIARAVAEVLADLRRRPRVSELARSVGLSRAAFARRFLAALGEPPERYFTRRRLARAAQRLVTSDDGLAAIAADVGFASEQAFSRAFRRHFGESPGAYRLGWRSSEAPLMAA